jgi:hypothetical protein
MEHFIKTDNNKIINVKCIKWVEKMGECLEVCTKSNGCDRKSGETHKICKLNNLDSYNKLNEHFEYIILLYEMK